MRALASAALLAGLLAGVASAQEPVNWTAQTAGETRLAYAVFPPGLAVIARCNGGTLELLLQGLSVQAPELEGAATFEGRTMRDVRWTRSGDGRYLIADHPAYLIRGLSQARPATLRMGDEDGPSFALTPPADGEPLAGVLDACGQPREAARDNAEPLALDEDEDFMRPPGFRAPIRASQAGISGWAELTCLTAGNGRVTDCEVEGDSPRDYGFGEAALAAASTVRLKPDTPVGRLVRIRMDGR